MFFSNFAVAEVGFLREFISVNESDQQAIVEIGVTSGILERDVTLHLQLTSETAQGY